MEFGSKVEEIRIGPPALLIVPAGRGFCGVSSRDPKWQSLTRWSN